MASDRPTLVRILQIYLDRCTKSRSVRSLSDLIDALRVGRHLILDAVEEAWRRSTKAYTRVMKLRSFITGLLDAFLLFMLYTYKGMFMVYEKVQGSVWAWVRERERCGMF